LLYRNVSSREDKYKEACFKVEISRRNPTNLISTNYGNVISGSAVPSGLVDTGAVPGVKTPGYSRKSRRDWRFAEPPGPKLPLKQNLLDEFVSGFKIGAIAGEQRSTS